MKQAIDSNAVAISNATSRNAGAVGKNALVPRVVRDRYGRLDDLNVLDFGAGKAAAHAVSMQVAYSLYGWQVDAFEFGANVVEGLHLSEQDADRNAGLYHVVYASNVLNTVSSWSQLHVTLATARRFTRYTGFFIANYPASPRKSNVTPDEVEQALGQYWVNVVRVAGTKAAPVWECDNGGITA